MEGRSDDCFNDDGRLILRLDCCIIGCSRDDTAVMGAIVVDVNVDSMRSVVFAFCIGQKERPGATFRPETMKYYVILSDLPGDQRPYYVIVALQENTSSSSSCSSPSPSSYIPP